MVHAEEADGFYATRTPGSKSLADVVSIRPSSCEFCGCHHPGRYEGRLHQIKTSKTIKKYHTETRFEKTKGGWETHVIYHFYPVRKAAKK